MPRSRSSAAAANRSLANALLRQTPPKLCAATRRPSYAVPRAAAPRSSPPSSALPFTGRLWILPGGMWLSPASLSTAPAAPRDSTRRPRRAQQCTAKLYTALAPRCVSLPGLATARQEQASRRRASPSQSIALQVRKERRAGVSNAVPPLCMADHSPSRAKPPPGSAAATLSGRSIASGLPGRCNASPCWTEPSRRRALPQRS